MRTHDIAKYERVEMYLKAIATIRDRALPATVTRVAGSMGVSSPSAYEMLKRLEGQGLVRGDAQGYRLTAAGDTRAARIVRRLRLAERLLADVLHLDLPNVYEEACKMEHVIGDEVEERLADVLGHPVRCPHGLPIPGEGPEETQGSVPVDGLAPATRARVLSVPEEDTPVLAYLWRLGIRPGAEVELRRVAPFDGPVILRIGQDDQAVSRKVAGRIYVRPMEY